MVILDAVSLDLDNTIEHLATTWEVSTTPSFSDILLCSNEDYKNKLNIIFSENLDPDMEYYGRARALTSAGWTSWGNVDIFKVRNNTDLTPQDVFPTKVSIPRISTYRMILDSSLNNINPDDIFGTNTPIEKNPVETENNADKEHADQEFDDNYVIKNLKYKIKPNEHDITLFEIVAEGFEVIGNAEHKATSWWIEDSEGDVVWKDIADRINKKRVFVTDLMLKTNKSYRINAVFHTNSNDVSQSGMYTVVTGGVEDINLVSYLDQVSSEVDLELQLEWVTGVNVIEWEILSINMGNVSSIWKATTNSIVVTVPAGTLQPNSNYVLRIKTNLSDSYKYYPFITSIVTDESPDDSPTPLLVYPTNIVIGQNQQTKIFVETPAKNPIFINKNPDIFNFDENSFFILGGKVGSGKLYIKAKIPGYSENIIEVDVTVVAQNVDVGDGSTKYVKVKPDVIDVNVAEDKIATISTNCDKLIVETDSDKIHPTLEDRVLRILGLKDGKYEVIIIGYDLKENLVASCKVTGKVTDTGLPPPPPPPEKPVEYTLEVNPENVQVKAGNSSLVNVLTNAPYWDVRNSDGDFFTYKKMSSSNLKITCKKPGSGFVVIVASDDDGDVKQVTLPITCDYNIKETTLVFDEAEYTGKVLNDISIPFTSNITSPTELSVELDTSKIDLVQKKNNAIVVNPKYEAAGNKYTVYVTAQKDNSDTDKYNSATESFVLNVEQVVYDLNSVIKYPNDGTDDQQYKGGVYSEGIYYPPNPVTFRVYVHKEATEDNVDVIAQPLESGIGIVTGKTLGDVINKPGDPFHDMKPLDVYVKTGTNDDYGESDYTVFSLDIVVKVKGIPYTRKINLSPLPITQLSLSRYVITADRFSTISDVTVMTNADSYKFITSNSNVANPYLDEDNNLIIDTGTDGKAIITFEAKNESEVLVVTTLTLNVGDDTKTGELARPLQGERGFGVGMAPLYLSNKYNLTPVDPANVNNPLHDTFGNYKDKGNNIMVFIPKMYFRYDNDPDVISAYDSKIIGDKNKYILRASYEPLPGYFLDRCFINGGKIIDGVFVDKYNSSFSGSTPEELSIPRSVQDSRCGNNLIDKIVKTTTGTYKIKNSTPENDCYVINLPKNRGEYYSWLDVFVNSLMFKIAKATYHGYILKGNEETSPWYNLTNNFPQPIYFSSDANPKFNKVVNYSGGQSDFPAGGDTGPENYKYISHNGETSGVVDIYGVWMSLTGIATFPNAEENNTNPDNSRDRYIYIYKLKTDRSAIVNESFKDKTNYDIIGLPIPQDKLNQHITFKLDAKEFGNSLWSNNSDYNTDDYYLNSIGFTPYTNDIVPVPDGQGYSNTLCVENGFRTIVIINDARNLDYITICHATCYSGATTGTNPLYYDLDYNQIYSDGNNGFGRRVCLIPNIGETLQNIEDKRNIIKPYMLDENTEDKI